MTGDASDERTVKVRQLWPLLMVSDIERSVSFYRDGLGFALVGSAEDVGRMFWCRLERDGACIMLQQGDEPGDSGGRAAPAVTFYFVCDDAQAMFDELSGKGIELEPPVIAYYGMTQLFVPEPDGYAICFESPTSDWSG